MLRLRIGLLLALFVAHDGRASWSLPDYRYFRALSIDLVGRPPTRDELAAFERADFDLDAWIDTHLGGPSYAERLRRIYMDALRLELGPSFQFVPNPIMLRREQIVGPDGAPMYVYFRRGQRRVDPAIDGDFCLTRDDTGLQFPTNAPAIGFPRPVAQDVLDARTVVVKPWWLYADYRATVPVDLAAPDWAKRFPGFSPAPALLVEPDGSKTTAVRVCREEAQTADSGVIYVSGRTAPKKGDAPPGGRLTQPPGDSGFARAGKGRAVSCLSGTGFQNSIECGCGIGLERCMPGAGSQNEPPAFVMPAHTPLGAELPFDATPQAPASWTRLWWGEEARHFLDRIFDGDRDFREILTSRATEVNGPLAQFYRSMAGATCCGGGADIGYSQPEPLFEPGQIPEALVPEDTATWLPVADRGPHASGILTMPIFLAKYGSRRARAHVVYSAFLCKDFIADAVKLAPSDDPDLDEAARVLVVSPDTRADGRLLHARRRIGLDVAAGERVPDDAAALREREAAGLLQDDLRSGVQQAARFVREDERRRCRPRRPRARHHHRAGVRAVRRPERRAVAARPPARTRRRSVEDAARQGLRRRRRSDEGARARDRAVTAVPRRKRREAVRLALVLLAACASPGIAPSAPRPLPAPRTFAIDTTPKERRRMVSPEVYLRAYLAWFGGLVPLDVQNRARPKGFFDAWDDYLSALGLPDYKIDVPRQDQSNTLMLATLGRLGEALCTRAAEHDLHGAPAPETRVVFAFDATPHPTTEQFAGGFDVLHRTFLGYPARLAPSDRIARYFALYSGVAERHATLKGKPALTADELGWVAVCAALVQHPEAELY